MRALWPLLLALTTQRACAGAPSNGRTPTPEQLAYQAAEVTMYAHFSMCTFAPNGGCEQDTACRTNPPSLFNPGDTLNTTQWAETAVKMGAKEICLTAHHTGGFALFPSNWTNYTIQNSPYQDGKGDIVRDFTASCRQFGISPCLYFINAWDCWESADSPELYLERQLGMLTELSNRDRYGKIDRFWFDQYGFASRPGQSPPGLFPDAWSKIVEHVHAVSPGTMMLPGPDGCLNAGEGGGGDYPIVNYANDTLVCSYTRDRSTEYKYSTQIHGQHYVPFESDIRYVWPLCCDVRWPAAN
jgi:alpha-L-fucosidase